MINIGFEFENQEPGWYVMLSGKNDGMEDFDMWRIPRWRMCDGIFHVYDRAINIAMILLTGEGHLNTNNLHNK